MNIRTGPLITIVLIIGSLISAQASAQDKLNKRDLVAKADKAYYNLKNQGFNGFNCVVTPNWKRLLEDNYSSSSDDFPPLNLLSVIDFSVSVDKDGKAKIEPLTRDGGELQIVVQKPVSSMLQVITGFYQTWTAMVIQPPFPGPEDDFTVKEDGENYQISEKDSSNGQITMSKDFLISEIRVQIPESKIIMWPRYAKTDKGFLLTGQKSDLYEGQMKVDFEIHYQDIEGMKLPASVIYTVNTANRKLTAEIAFSKYKITKQSVAQIGDRFIP